MNEYVEGGRVCKFPNSHGQVQPDQALVAQFVVRMLARSRIVAMYASVHPNAR